MLSSSGSGELWSWSALALDLVFIGERVVSLDLAAIAGGGTVSSCPPPPPPPGVSNLRAPVANPLGVNLTSSTGGSPDWAKTSVISRTS